jgi:aspartokinase
MSLQETLAATPRSRPRVALERMVDEHGAGRRLVMVLSAMGRTTDQLNPPACAVEARPQLRQLDALLSVGKDISSALAALAVHDLGVPRVPLIGPQAGVLADDRHGNTQPADASQSAAATPSVDAGAIGLAFGGGWGWQVARQTGRGTATATVRVRFFASSLQSWMRCCEPSRTSGLRVFGS